SRPDGAAQATARVPPPVWPRRRPVAQPARRFAAVVLRPHRFVRSPGAGTGGRPRNTVSCARFVAGRESALGNQVHGPADRDTHDAGLAVDPAVAAQLLFGGGSGGVVGVTFGVFEPRRRRSW